MASGAKGLLLHDCGPGLPHHQAFHGSAGDNPHSAAHSIPNASADTTANIAARSSATATATARSSATAATSPDSASSSSASPGASGTSRPLQLCGGHMDDVGCRQEGMVLHQSQHLRWQPDPAAGSS